MVETDVIVVRTTFAVTPRPTHRETGVIEIVHIVVLNGVVGRVADPDADSRRMQPPAIRNRAVANRVVGDNHLLVRSRLQAVGPRLRHVVHGRRMGQGVADLDTTAPHVHQLTTLQPIVLASGSEADGILTHISHGTILPHHVPRRYRGDRGSQVDLGLRKRLAVERQVPVRMRKCQSAELQVLHPSFLGCVTGDQQ